MKDVLNFCVSVIGIEYVPIPNEEEQGVVVINELYSIEDTEEDSATLKAVAEFSREHKNAQLISKPNVLVFDGKLMVPVDLCVGDEDEEE